MAGDRWRDVGAIAMYHASEVQPVSHFTVDRLRALVAGPSGQIAK